LNAGNRKSVVLNDFQFDVAQYGNVSFWDEFYLNNPDPFEWYYDWDYFEETIRSYLPSTSKILIAGAGNSNFPSDMIKYSEYKNLVVNDLSRVAMEHLRTRLSTLSNLPEVNIEYFQGNMRDTHLPRSSFDGIIDKALLDSLLCDSSGEIAVQQYLQEVDSTSLIIQNSSLISFILLQR
jgi:hypothetical protein